MPRRRTAQPRQTGPRPTPPLVMTNNPPTFTEMPEVSATGIVEVPPPPVLVEAHINAHNRYLSTYMFGECSIIVTREFGQYHLSIAHPSRDPTWHEIAAAWYRTVPAAATRTGVLKLPPLHEYINVHNHCFQVFEVPDEADVAMPMLDRPHDAPDPGHGDTEGGSDAYQADGR